MIEDGHKYIIKKQDRWTRIENINAKKRWGPALLPSERELYSIYNSSPAIAFLWIAEKDWPVKFVSENITQFGYTPEEFTSEFLKYGDIIHPDDLEDIRSKVLNYCENESDHFSLEYRILTKSGDIRWVSEHSSIRYTHNDITYLQGIILDITRKKEIESKLEISEKKFKMLFDNSSDPILILDMEGQILEVNQMTCDSIGYSQKELIKMNIVDIKAQECKDRCHEHIKEISLQETATWESIIVKKNGFTLPVEIKAKVGEYKEKEAIYVTARDTTERKNAEKKILQAKMMAEASNRLKSEFLANMSHELRTPLNAVIGFSDILIGENFGELNHKQEKYVKNISISGRHLLEIINSILDLSKIEAGKIELQYEEFSISDVIIEVNNILSTIAEKKTIKLNTIIDKEIKTIIADKGKLKQILYNLISNAVKFTPHGGVVNVEAYYAGDIVQIDVMDTGIGIPEEEQKILFHPFVQLDSSASREYSGTGLGLTIVDRLVKLHKGNIWIKSEVGKGSTFTFTIPVKENPRSEKSIRKPDQIPDEKAIIEEDTRSEDENILKKIAYENAQENNFRTSCNLYTNIVEKGDDAIILVQDGIVKYANRKMAEFSGCKKNEIVETPFLKYVPTQYKKSVLKKYNKIIKGSGVCRPIKNELELLSKYGFSIPVEMSFSCIEYEGREAVIIIIKDLTERRSAEKTLKEKIEAETANRSKSEFLANMSHELRTPLNSIIGFSDVLLSENFGILNNKQFKYLNNISTSGKHLLDIINSILDLSKVEAGKMELQYEKISIPTSIEQVKGTLKPIASKKDIKINVEIRTEQDTIIADKNKFKQILYNLISNAVKFTPEGSSVTVEAESMEDFVQIKVIDTGIGICEEDKKTIFDPFIQVDSSHSRQYTGTGLGLPIVEKFVKLHEGEIWIESELNKGSTFTFTLPIKPEPKFIQMENIGSKKSTEKLSDNKKKYEIIGSENSGVVLVVEDDINSSELLTIILNEAGYGVVPAYTGKEALKILDEIDPIAITLDIMMPGMHGWELLKKIKSREKTRDIPAIIISMVDEKRIGFEMGAFDYLIKPFDRKQIIKSLGRIKGKISHKNPRILVVDDDQKAVELIAAMIEAEGFEIIKAYGGEEGIEKAFNNSPDMIILDLMMPRTNGFDVITRLKENVKTRDIPIVISTAKSLTDEDLKQLEDNTHSILQKGAYDGHKFIEDIKKLTNTPN